MHPLSFIHFNNAWVLVVPVWLTGIAIAMTNGEGMKRAADMSWYTRRDGITSFAVMFFMIAFMAISFFIRMDIHSPWFTAGLVMALTGFTANIAAKVSYANAGRGQAITGGIYRHSRNPMYTSFSLVMLGTAIASRSLLLFGMWIVIAVCTHLLII